MALDPPPISVDLRGASFPEIIHALETVTGESFNNSARNGLINPDQTFTLSATEKPFWEIVRDLSGQHGLQIHGRFGLSVFQAAPGLRLLQITGPLIAYDPVITSTTYFEPRNIPGQPAGQIPAFSLSYSIALDPRLKVAKFIPPQLFEIVDDAGTVLLQQQPPPGPPAWNVNARATLFTAGQLMPKPEKIGKTIASAKGRFIVTVRLAAETADVANIDARLKQPINLAGQTVVISEFIPLGNTIRLQLSRDYEAGAQNQTAAPMSATLIDSTGEPFWSSDLPLGSTSQTINAARPPYKIQFTVTTKSKELALPFELKNIPIP